MDDLAAHGEKFQERATTLISRLGTIGRENEHTGSEKNRQAAALPEAHALAQPVRASQLNLLKLIWQETMGMPSGKKINDLKDSLWERQAYIQRKNTNLDPRTVREIATREYFRDNPADIWEIFEIFDIPADTISLLQEEYDDDRGLYLFFADHHHQRLRSIRNAPGHEDEDSYNLDNTPSHLYLTEKYVEKYSIDKPLEAHEFIERIAQTAFRARALTQFLQDSENAPTVEDIESFDTSLGYRIWHSGEATASSLLTMFAKLHWGPEDFVLNEDQLKRYHSLVKSHGIVILQGPGALGKTALAHKLLYDYCLGHNSPYGDTEEKIEKFVPYSTKVGSPQMTLSLGEGDDPLRPTDESVTVFKTLLADLEEDEDATFYQRLNGASRRLWVEIVQQYQEVSPIDTDVKLRKLSLSLMKEKKILLIIDNFEDLESPPNYIPDSDRETIEAEREKIRKWLEELHVLGSRLTSRVIITTRGPGGEQSPLSPSIPIPGYKHIVAKLSADDAHALFTKKITTRLSQHIDQRIKSKLQKHIRTLQQKKRREELREAFNGWTNDGLSHPAILIHAANSLENYDSMEECIQNWKDGNESSDYIFDYCTRKMVDTIGWEEPQKRFITSLLSKYNPEDGFDTDQLEFNGDLLKGDKQDTQSFLDELRLFGYLRRTDLPHGVTHYVWVPEYASAFRSIFVEDIQSEVPKRKAARAPEPTNQHSIQTEIQKQNIATLENWEIWIDGAPDLSTEQSHEPPWIETRGADDILKRVVRNTQAGLGFRKFDGYTDQHLVRVVICCDKTLRLFCEQMGSGSDFGLWGRTDRVGWSRVGSRTAAGLKESTRIQERVDESISGGLHILGAALKEIRTRERERLSIIDSQVPDLSKQSLAYSHHRLSECIRAYQQYRPDEFSGEFTDAILSLMLSNADLAARITNSEPEFTTLMTQSAKIMKALEIDHKEASLDIPENLRQHYKRWYRIYDKYKGKLDFQNLSLMDTFSGYLFWISLRLWKLHPSKQGDFEEWEDKRYLAAGKKLVDKKMGAHAVDSHVRTVRKSRADHIFQHSFDEIGMSSKPYEFVKKGDYIQVELEKHRTYSRQLGVHSEIRCQVVPGLDYPGKYLVMVDQVRENTVYAEVMLDEEENPLICRPIDNEIYERAKIFLASMDLSKTTPLTEFLKKLQSHFSPEEIKILEWITDQKLDPVKSMCQYSKGMSEITTIYSSINFVGADQTELQSKESELQPKYMERFGKDAEIIYKLTSKKDRRRSMALPSHPKLLADIIVRISSQAQEVIEGETFERSYEDLSNSWAKISYEQYRDFLAPNSVRTEPMCAQIFRLIRWGGKRKVKGKEEQVDWSKIPTNPEDLSNQIRIASIDSVKHRIRRSEVDYPNNWETILGSYFDEVDSHCTTS